MDGGNLDHIPKLCLDVQTPDQSARVWELIGRIQKGDRLSPVTVVGPSVYANLTLRHEFARYGFANVRFMALSRVAELLGAPQLAAGGRRPLTRIVESAAVRAVAQQSVGPLSNVRNNPSTHLSLKRSFRQMASASGDALDRLSRQSPLRAEVVELYRRFRERTRDLYDEEDLFSSAADAIRSDRATGLADLGFIILFRIANLTPARNDMIDALAATGGCSVLLGLTGDVEADAAVEELADRLRLPLGQPARLPSHALPAHTELLIAPDPREEIRWVIRRIMKRAERGTPFHRLAVLYRKPEPYSSMIREELELARIPASGPDTSPIASTAVGRTLRGLLAFSDGDFSRTSVMDWLTGCPVRPARHLNPRFVPSRWDAISKSAGIVRGLDQWGQRLRRYADGLDQQASDGEAQGELSEGRASSMRSEAVSARDLLEFMQQLAVDVSPPADGSPWVDFCGWARDLLMNYLIHEADIPESEHPALKAIEDILSDLPAVQELSVSPSFDTFRQAVDELLSAPVGHLGPTGQGVFVSQFGVATAMRFDSVHLVGMVEGAVPPVVRDDPLIPDRDRVAAGGRTAGLPLERDRSARERHAFLSALATAPDRALSFPVSEPAGGRANYPSRWFLEQASELEGRRIAASDLEGGLGRRWLTVIPSMEEALATVASASPADIHDYGLERIWSWKRAGRPVRGHPLAGTGPLAAALSLGRQRNSRRFTEWDGNVSSSGAAGFASRLDRSVHSPTSLERWAKCPFSYFLGRVLNIGALDKPEDAYSITPLAKGSMVHGILEKFVGQALQSGTAPGPGDPWTQEHRSELRHIAGEAFADAEAIGATGKALMWELDREEILRDLDTFLELDSENRARFGVSPAYAEAEFGTGQNAWPVAVCDLDDGTQIRFRGMIDRVDTRPDGGKALVIDYKTGGSRSYSGIAEDPIDRGQRLQLGVYSLAVRQALGADVEVSAAYWFVTSAGGFGFAPTDLLVLDSADNMTRFREGVSSIVSGIRSGVFPADPGKRTNWGFENCRFCDFDSLCPSRRDTIWARKESDDVVAGYLELSGGADR